MSISNPSVLKITMPQRIPLQCPLLNIELVSKELNHLAAILHVYAGGLIFMENGNTLTLLIIILVKSIQKEQIAKITQYDP